MLNELVITKEDIIKKQQDKISYLEGRIKWHEIHYDSLRTYVNRLIRENNTDEIRMFKAKLHDNNKQT